jgi:hypothetical protein
VADPTGSSPPEFAACIRAEYEKQDKVIQATGTRCMSVGARRIRAEWDRHCIGA